MIVPLTPIHNQHSNMHHFGIPLPHCNRKESSMSTQRSAVTSKLKSKVRLAWCTEHNHARYFLLQCTAFVLLQVDRNT